VHPMCDTGWVLGAASGNRCGSCSGTIADVTASDTPESAVFHTWTQAEREGQLAEFARRCSGLANGFAAHDPLASAEFRERADQAKSLLLSGYTQSDLDLLAGQFPRGAWWLNPKALDYDAHREAWQLRSASSRTA
jgi:hypothetical protein